MTQKEVEHIISQIKEGDSNAFSLIVEEYKDMVYSLCLKMTRSSEDAQEIAQDAFVKAYTGIAKFKGKSKFSTWLYQIAYFTAINVLRKNRIETTSDRTIDIPNGDQSILSEIHEEDRKKYISDALDYLSVEERSLITLYHLEEQSIQEISQITKLSPSNVKVKLLRTRKKLYGVLEMLLQKEMYTLL